eukprot:1350842-Amorphochlora_amoeboformis.AAC.2
MEYRIIVRDMVEVSVEIPEIGYNLISITGYFPVVPALQVRRDVTSSLGTSPENSRTFEKCVYSMRRYHETNSGLLVKGVLTAQDGKPVQYKLKSALSTSKYTIIEDVDE